MKLKTKIVLLFATVIVLGTAAMGAFSIYTVQSKLAGVVPAATFDTFVSSFRNSVILFGLIGLVFAILASWLVADRYARPLLRLIQTAERVAQGDLRVEQLDLHRADEIGKLSLAMNGMVENLHSLIAGVNSTAGLVAQAANELSTSTDNSVLASEQITQTIQQVAAGAEEQLGATNETDKSIREMVSGIAQVAETAVVVAEASYTTAEEAEQGNDSIQKAIAQMERVSAAIDRTAAGIRSLEVRSHEVGQIVEVITSIAAQTNLLALNAAVEAARAGEQGKGFSVVADEVRKLAEQASASAGQIAQLIQSIQAEMIRSGQSMDQVIHEVQVGTETVQVANIAFQRIKDSAIAVSEKIQDVTASAEEMSAGSQMVIEEMETVTHIAELSSLAAKQVATSSEEQMQAVEGISKAAEAMKEMAQGLQEMIAKFTV